MTDFKATTAENKAIGALIGDSTFGALLSQAMNEGSQHGAAGAAGEVQSSVPLSLSRLLSVLLEKEEATSTQTPETSAGQAALQTPSDESLKASAGDAKPSAVLDITALLSAFLGEDTATSGQTLRAEETTVADTTTSTQTCSMPTNATGSSGAAAGITRDEGTAAGTNLKPEQQLQDLVMGLLALVMMKDAGAGGRTGAATGSDGTEEKSAAEAGNGLITGVKGRDNTGLSRRSGVSSNNGASTSTSETDNRHLLDTLALLFFTGLEAMQREPGKESGASGETQSLLPNEGRTETGTGIAVPGRPAAGGPAEESANMLGRETVASAGDKPNGFAARLLGAGTDAASSTSPTAVRAEFALTPAGEAGSDENSLSLQILVAGAGASARTNRAVEAAGSVQEGTAAGAKGAGSASQDAVVTIVKELTPLLLEGRDGNASHDKAAGIDSPGAKGVYPVTLDDHVSTNNEPTQDQQVSWQPGSAGTIERFDRVMEQVGGGTGPHDMTVRLTVGNGESLVLGLKDLGQTVTVEVRASNQGMVDLLQSQRDVIIRHLEGKDISANIVIDPNASGTPEKRDRRETRQRTLAARGKVGGGFDGLLEVFA